MNATDAGKMALDGVVMRAELCATWREARYNEGRWQTRHPYGVWAGTPIPFSWPGSDFDGWEPVHPEGSRKWARAQVKLIDPETGKRKLVRQDGSLGVVYCGWDEGGFYRADWPGEQDKSYFSTLGPNCTDESTATGWSIWEPPEPEPEPPVRVVRLVVERSKRVDSGRPTVTPPGLQGHVPVALADPDRVVAYVYTLPDGTEHTLRTLGAVWCWPAKGNWPWFYSLLPMDGERPDARLAKLTHVLWREAGDD